MAIAPFPISSEATPLAAAHFGLGNLHVLREKFAEAQIHFRHAIRFAPHLPGSHFALGFTHNKLGQHPQAIACYTAAIRLCPSFASAWLNLGVALNADGQSHLAPHCYRQALATNLPSDPSGTGTQISAHLNLGHYFRNRHCFSQAQQHYEAALSLAQAFPERLPEIHVAFSYFHVEQSQFPQAWQSIREAVLSQNGPVRDSEIPNVQGILLLAEQIWVPHVSNPQVPQRQVSVVGAVRHGISPLTPVSEFALIEEAILAFQQAEDLGHKTAPATAATPSCA
jgi:tetratricopeptide (TPR) repeat protein